MTRNVAQSLAARCRRLTRARLTLAALAVMIPAGCGDQGTARLTPAQEQRYASEGIARRAADLTFRYTRDPGGRDERWEDRRASIVVTRASLLIHKNDKVGMEITPRTQRQVAVQRSGRRIRIRSGSGRSEEVWSFEPPTDAEGWTADIRSLLKGSKGGSPARD